MPRYHKKPVEIDTLQWVGQPIEEVIAFCPPVTQQEEEDTLLIPTLEGLMTASMGDWIIRGVEGEYYPCKPRIFAATYELLEPVGESTAL